MGVDVPGGEVRHAGRLELGHVIADLIRGVWLADSLSLESAVAATLPRARGATRTTDCSFGYQHLQDPDLVLTHQAHAESDLAKVHRSNSQNYQK
jgi:hypothetical protein